MQQSHKNFSRLSPSSRVFKTWLLIVLIPSFVILNLLTIQDKSKVAFSAQANINSPTEIYEWDDLCIPQRLEISGIGMGDRHNAINPQTLSITEPGNINVLLAQVAGRRINEASIPNSVVFSTDTQQIVIQNEPSDVSSQSYNFVAELQSSGMVTATVENTGSRNHQTPRGLILYTQRATETDWSSVGQITNNYVYPGGEYSLVLDFPPLTQATDLFVTAIVTDNDDDERPMVLEAKSAHVSASVTESGPTNGILLNIVNLTLPQVPEGTNQVRITLRSPSIEGGDSAVLSGVNVSFPCLPSPQPEARIHILPSPATIPESTTQFLTVTVTPGVDSVNGVQIEGRVNKNYLDLVSIIPIGPLTEIISEPQIKESGDYYYFQFAAGLLSGEISEPFPVLELEVQGKMQINETLIEFLDSPKTGVSGPSGNVLSVTQDGIISVSPPPKLTGRVDMQGRPDTPHSSWSIPLTITLTPLNNNLPAKSYPVTTNEYGQFVLPLYDIGIPGQYDIMVKGNHTLRNLAEDIELILGDNEYYFGTLLEGDVETGLTFNKVVQDDVDKLINHFNTCSYDPIRFFPNADLDENDCIQLADFGLLSGNFGRSGDVIVPVDHVTSPQNFRVNTNQVLIAFDDEEQMVAVDDIITVDLYIEPHDQFVNGAMINLMFDPISVEILDVTLEHNLPLVLMSPTIDNIEGEVNFATGIIAQTITERFSVATISLKVKSITSSTSITLVDTFPATVVSGMQGEIPTNITGLTLKTIPEGTIFLPVILR